MIFLVCCHFLFFFLFFRYSFTFPSLQTLGEDLVTVLDFLHVKYIIGLGEGAGANVLARFGLAHQSRCLGLILINCTGSAAGVLSLFKTKVKENSFQIFLCFWLMEISNYNSILNSLSPWFTFFLFSLLAGKVLRWHNRLLIFYCTINLVT